MNDTIRGLPNGDFEVPRAPAESIFDWHTWSGGEMPVPQGTLIDVEYRNGEVRACEAGGPGAAEWWNFGSTRDILRYRLREPAREFYPASTIGESNDPRRPGPTCARHWPTHHMDCQTCKDTCNRRIEMHLLATERAEPAVKFHIGALGPFDTATEAIDALAAQGPKHSHYFKDVARLQTVDVYRVLALFNVVDPCLQHAVKKLLVAGGRGGGKDISRDIQEAIDTLQRWQAMRAEEVAS